MIPPNSKQMICDYCKKNIRKFNNKCVIHENICQTKPKLVFCTQKCKLEWCRDAQNGIIRKILTWTVKKRKKKYFFVKKCEKSNPISDNAAKMSYFSKKIYLQNNNLKKENE